VSASSSFDQLEVCRALTPVKHPRCGERGTRNVMICRLMCGSFLFFFLFFLFFFLWSGIRCARELVWKAWTDPKCCALVRAECGGQSIHRLELIPAGVLVAMEMGRQFP